MNFKINASIDNDELINETISVPISPKIKTDINTLKRVLGNRSVNKKIRELFECLIEENKDKLQKAS